MNDFEKKEPQGVMLCETTDKTIAELEQEGWEYLYSFHHNNPDQWQDACGKAQQAALDDLYEVVLVLGQNEEEQKDGVQYLYKKKTQKLLDLEKQHGY